MTNEQIEKNYERFKSLFQEIINDRPEATNLLAWIETTDFKYAPASVRHHLAEEGGLVQHSLNVYDELERLIKYFGFNYDALGTDASGVKLISLCHDLCKANSTKQVIRNEKVYTVDGDKEDALGRFKWVSKLGYERAEDIIMGHGSKSLFLVQALMQDISIEEAAAIRFHMGGFESPNTNFAEPYASEAFLKYPLSYLIHMADMNSTYILEKSE